MPSRVRDKKIKFRKINAACRSITAALIFVIYGGFTFTAGLENIVVNAVENRIVTVFLVQDILLIACGVLLFLIGPIYGAFGFCQWNYFIRNKLRIGRRTILHLVFFLILPSVVWVIIGIIAQIKYHGAIPTTFPHSNVKIFPRSIWVGFGQSVYKVIFAIVMWLVTLICLIMYWVNVFTSSTFRFLLKKGAESKAIEYIHGLKRAKPKISLISTDYSVRNAAPSSFAGASEEITQDVDEVPFLYTNCFDASGNLSIKQQHTVFRCVKVRYVKLNLYWCYVWDREKNRKDFEATCKKILLEREKKIPEGSNVFSRIDVKACLKNFENSVLIRTTDIDPFWCNTFIYAVASFFGMSLLYRHLFDLICVEREFKFIKRISTDQEIDRRKVYDQNLEVDSINAMYVSTPTNSFHFECNLEGFEAPTIESKNERSHLLGVEDLKDPESPVTPIPFHSGSEERVSKVLDTRVMTYADIVESIDGDSSTSSPDDDVTIDVE